jgi:aryl-alcohol dehydrogenase-like predicted oxidoreductase
MLRRRTFLQGSTAALLSTQLAPVFAAQRKLITRAIPSSGEQLPVIGMGSSRTFDTGTDAATLANLMSVMQTFIDGGGTLIDSSPMYGAAESVLGEVLASMQPRPKVFAATKVWIDGKEDGVRQMRESSERMQTPVFDLIQVHNLRDWKLHFDTLNEWKKAGKVRYTGITTSHQRSHAELEDIMRTQPMDFVQFSYNIDNRLAEERLLPLAADRGIATLINRPFQRGALFKRTQGKPLPALAADLECTSWGQFFLKFILAHPAVTCLIPATSKVHHMQDNMGANFGPVPDATQRKEMLGIYDAL